MYYVKKSRFKLFYTKISFIFYFNFSVNFLKYPYIHTANCHKSYSD